MDEMIKDGSIYPISDHSYFYNQKNHIITKCFALINNKLVD